MTGEGVASLLAEIGTQLRPKREFLELRVPHEQAAVIARLHQVGQVISRSYRGPAARFKARIPPQYHDEFAPYIVRECGMKQDPSVTRIVAAVGRPPRYSSQLKSAASARSHYAGLQRSGIIARPFYVSSFRLHHLLIHCLP